MNERQDHAISLQPAQSRETFLANAPWKATSVLAAAGAAVAGLTALFGEQVSPALTRGGVSYIGGYVVGWTMRRAMKVAALSAGLILAAIASLKSAGWVDLDWTSLESHVSRSLSWLNGKAEGLKTLLTGWLPSAGAGGAGVYFGFRKK